MRVMLGVALSATLLLSGAAAAPSGKSCGRAGADATLSGSRWSGTFTWEDDEAVFQTMTLRPDCVLVYSYDGNTYDNGRWLQRGALVLWDTNDHFAVYMGKVDGRRMAGVMANENGDAGTWSIERTD